jgi:hypothetical protein
MCFEFDHTYRDQASVACPVPAHVSWIPQALDCSGCIYLLAQLSNGCDVSTYCFLGKAVSRENKPFLPCSKKFVKENDKELNK